MRDIPEGMSKGDRHLTKVNGELEIVEYRKWSDVTVRFVETGYQTVVRADHVRDGMIRDPLRRSVCGVGFIGIGSYKPSKNGKDSKCYSAWAGMIQRCYSEARQEIQPTYRGCIVCEEWHNFQNYAEWYYENYPQDGGEYHVDKDLSAFGESGKIYSPDTCVFVTPQVNAEEAHAKCYRFRSPEGEIVDVYNLRQFCIKNGLNRPNMCKVHSGERAKSKGWSKA